MKKHETTPEKGQVYADKNLKSRGQKMLDRHNTQKPNSDESILSDKDPVTKESNSAKKGADHKFDIQDEFIDRDNAESRDANKESQDANKES